jgi:hypothetical protein
VREGRWLSREPTKTNLLTLAIPASDQAPAGTDLMQHIWNRLIADFVKAIRRGDAAHRSAPHLPSLTDGLRGEEIIAAARARQMRRGAG